jgi:hypothetical protein
VDCLHKEMHRQTVSVWSSLFILINQYPASWYGFAGCFNCVRDRVSPDLEKQGF